MEETRAASGAGGFPTAVHLDSPSHRPRYLGGWVAEHL